MSAKNDNGKETIKTIVERIQSEEKRILKKILNNILSNKSEKELITKIINSFFEIYTRFEFIKASNLSANQKKSLRNTLKEYSASIVELENKVNLL
jgi:hypothetical protein